MILFDFLLLLDDFIWTHSGDNRMMMVIWFDWNGKRYILCLCETSVFMSTDKQQPQEQQTENSDKISNYSECIFLMFCLLICSIQLVLFCVLFSSEFLSILNFDHYQFVLYPSYETSNFFFFSSFDLIYLLSLINNQTTQSEWSFAFVLFVLLFKLQTLDGRFWFLLFFFFFCFCWRLTISSCSNTSISALLFTNFEITSCIEFHYWNSIALLLGDDEV